MADMNDETLNHHLDILSEEATGNNSTFIKINEELLRRYEADPYGDEQPERSQVVSNDCMDIVESDMPSLARIFLGPGEVMKFRPNSGRPEDKQEAEEKTKYINWQIREQDWSFRILNGFIKNAEIHQLSVLKYFMEECTEVEEHKFTGVSNAELAKYQEDFEKEQNVKSVEVVREEEHETETDAGDPGENTVVFKVKRTTKQAKAIDVPLETFRMSKNATDKDSAALVGDVTIMTRGELRALGFDRETISLLEKATKDQEAADTTLAERRDHGEGGTENQQKVVDSWASEEVLIEDLYPLIDYDDDGTLERRHIMRSGGGDKTILINEVFNHVPYAMMSAIMMPHKAIGKSRVEVTAPTARNKTAIMRGINDNIYAVNSPRIGANTNVNIDDLLVMRPQGVVRMFDDSPPGQNLFPIEVPYIGDKALQVMQYLDHSRAQTTGSLMANQGLDADKLHQETATRFEGVAEDSDAKIELVARTMAETGFRQLYEGFAWLNAHFQNSKVEVEILGGELTVDPSNWKFKHSVVSKVGLGAGDDEKILQTLSALWTLHLQLQERGSPMTDEVKRYNVLKGMVKASGLPEVSEIFNDPEKPEELTLAQNEILQGLVEQLQVQVQQLQNPLAEAEKIKAEAKLIEANAKQGLEQQKFHESQRQFNADMMNTMKEFMETMQFKYTELAAKTGQQSGAKPNANKPGSERSGSAT